MSEWKEYRLGELININAKSIGRNYQHKEIEYLDTGSITRGKIEGLQSFELRNAPNRAKRLVKDNDIVYSTVRPIQRHYGIVKNPKSNLVVSTGFAVLSCDEERTNSKFIYYFLTSDEVVNYLDMVAEGSTSAYPSLTPDVIADIDILLPSLPEQQSIASILSSLDDKIDLLHRQNNTLEALAETLFRQWFVEEAEEGWEEKQLSEFMTITSSKRIFYSEYVSYGIPFYRSKEIIELRNSGSTNSELFIPMARFNDIKKKFGVPMRGDILLTSVGTLGIPFRVRNNDEFYFKDGNLTWFKDFKGISSSIIYFWLLSRIGQEQIKSITIGSTQEAITIDGLKGLNLRLPPKNLLGKYEEEFESIHLRIESNQNQIRTLTYLRDMLLPKLISGQIRINTLENLNGVIY